MSPDSFHNQFGQSVGAKIREARVAKRLTQSQLARPDFSVSYISAIERGQIHPSIRALEILATRLGLSSTQLLPSQVPGEGGQALASGLFLRGEDEVDLALLEMQIYICQGTAARALTQLQKLAPKNLKRRQQAHVRYLLGWAYRDTGKLHEAETTFNEATQLAKDLSDTSISAHISYLLGTVYAAMRNYAQALLLHQHCLTLLEGSQVQDPFFIAQVYANMGQYYIHLGRVEQAIDMLRRAINVIEAHTEAQHPELAYWNLSQQYTEAKEYFQATLNAYKCLYLYNQRSYVLLKSEIYHYLYHAMMKIDQEGMRARLDEDLQSSSQVYEPLARASAKAHLATWLLEHHALDEAEKDAQEARHLSSSSGDTIVGAEALLVLGRIAYEKSDYQEGDTCFTSGLDMLERLDAHEELAEQAMYYVQLLERQGKDRAAIAYIRRAYESRQKISRYIQG